LQKKAEKLYQVVNGFGSEFAFVIGNNSYQLRPNVIEMNSQRGRK
jgi:hypothetical protein